MDIHDSRTSWKDFWSSRPTATRLLVMGILAGLVAMYSVMGLLAIFGIWRNNLLSTTSNWPWSLPLAALSLIGRRFNRTVTVHGIVFIPLLAYQCGMLVWYRASGVMTFSFKDVWYMPVSIIAIATVNMLAFRQFTREEPHA